MQRISRLEWRVDVLAQALAEVVGLTQYPQYDPLRRLARANQIARDALARAGHDHDEGSDDTAA